MIVPIVYSDINFKLYTISDDCIIRRGNDIIQSKNIIYHSSNGFDYVMLEKLNGVMSLFRLEFVMYNSFHPDTQIKYEHFYIRHLDGDIRNCNINNIECCEDIERWVDVIYPANVKKNMYEVSSWGKIRNKNTGLIMKYTIDKDGYPKIKLMSDRYSKKVIYTHPYRIVALHFLHNPKPNEFTNVNHINGDKLNSHISNLEWISVTENNKHAKMLGLNYNENHRAEPSVPTDQVDMIVGLLLDKKYYSSPKEVYQQIDHNLYPNITYNVIRRIKERNKCYLRKDSVYDLEHISFPDAHKSKITTNEITMVKRMLSDPQYNGSPKQVYENIDHDKYPKLTKSVIAHIKYNKSTYVRDDLDFKE